MKSTICTAPSTSSTTSFSLINNYNIRTIDRSKIPNLSGFADHESRMNEALSLAALLRELVSPSCLAHPEYPGSENILVPFDSACLEGKAREGMGYIVGRIEDVLQECYEAIYGAAAEVDKSEVAK